MRSDASEDLVEALAGVEEDSPDTTAAPKLDVARVRDSLSQAQQEALRSSWELTAGKSGKDDRVDLNYVPKSTTRKLVEFELVKRKNPSVSFDDIAWRNGGFELTEAGILVARELAGRTAAEQKQKRESELAAQRRKNQRRHQERQQQNTRVRALAQSVEQLGMDLPSVRDELSKPHGGYSFLLPVDEMIRLLEAAELQLRSRGG